MAPIFILRDDDVLLILQHLDIQDQMAFAYTCQRLREIFYRARIFRKVDLSRSAILRTQHVVISKFFSDKQMVQHIRELDLSNRRFPNWQMNDQLEECIISISPHLQALHVLNCEMSFQRLQRILQQAPKLTALSWSLRDLTSKDVEFLLKGSKSSDGIFLKNIKHLHLEAFSSLSHIRVLKHMVSYCKYLEALEIYIWQIDVVRDTKLVFPLPNFDQPSTFTEDVLQYLHSLTVVAMKGRSHSDSSYMAELSDFVSSVVRKKSRETKWKKLWIMPPIGIWRLQSSVSLSEDHPHELQSLAIAAHAGHSVDAMHELKTLFQRIGDNTVRSLHLCLPTSQTKSILELSEPILRVGGRTLEFLSLSLSSCREIYAEQNIALHTLFSNCSNITELDLFECYFRKDICEPLSKLRHLTKVQLMKCAICSKLSNENQVEMSKANLLTFVESCQKITHFDLHGCHDHGWFSCCLTDAELLLLTKFRNLESLTLCRISGIRQWTFLQNIMEHCQFLTTLRIIALEDFNKFHIPILFKSAKFLKHLALFVPYVDYRSNAFWNLLSHATNLQRLCIKTHIQELLDITGIVEMLKRLPQLHVLHLHCCFVGNVEAVCHQIIRLLEDDHRFSFELVIDNLYGAPKPWIWKKALPLNEVELCNMTSILEIPSC